MKTRSRAQRVVDVGRFGSLSRAAAGATLAMLLIVIVARCLLTEHYQTRLSTVDQALDLGTDAGPLIPLGMAGLLLAANVLFWLSRRRGGVWRVTGLEIGWVLCVVAAGVSCAFAGNKRLAITAACDWLTVATIGMLLPQLIDRAWRQRLVLCVLLATGTAFAGRCIAQVGWEYAQTAERFAQQQREAEQAGRPTMDPRSLELFVSRLNAREATGFFAMSNVAGTLMAAMLLTAGGWTAVRWRRGDRVGAAAVAAVALTVAVGLALTKSRGGIAAAGVGAVAVLALYVVRRWGRLWRLWLAAGWLGFALAAAGVVAVGLRSGGLGNKSMTFRWHYWTAAVQMVRQHPITGVGPANFGQHYTAYKPPVNPEEVKDPHNVVVRFASEWGLIGLVGCLTMLVGGSIMAARPAAAGDDESTCPAPSPPIPASQSRRSRGWAAGGQGERGLAAAARPPHPNPLPRRRGRGDKKRPPSRDALASQTSRQPTLAGSVGRWCLAIGLPAFGLQWLFQPCHPQDWLFLMGPWLLVWVVVFLLLGARRHEIARFDDASLTGLSVCLGGALLAFLAHSMVDMPLSFGGSAGVGFALFGLLVAVRGSHGRSVRLSATGAKVGLLVSLAGLIAFTIWVLRPPASAMAAVRQARLAARRPAHGPPAESPITAHYRRAAADDPLDPSPLSELGDWLAEAGMAAARAGHSTEAKGALEAAARALRRAHGRDPHSAHLCWALANVHARRYRMDSDPSALDDALQWISRAVEAYPSLPQWRLRWAGLLAEKLRRTDDADLRDAALRQYRLALEYDRQQEPGRQLSAPQRAAALDAIGRL